MTHWTCQDCPYEHGCDIGPFNDEDWEEFVSAKVWHGHHHGWKIGKPDQEKNLRIIEQRRRCMQNLKKITWSKEKWK